MRVVSPIKAAVTRRWDRQVAPWGSAACQPWGAAKPRSYPFKASGAYCTKQGEEKEKASPSKNCKGEARAGAFIAGSLNGREEQGLSSLPLALSCSTKQPPSLRVRYSERF